MAKIHCFASNLKNQFLRLRCAGILYSDMKRWSVTVSIIVLLFFAGCGEDAPKPDDPAKTGEANATAGTTEENASATLPKASPEGNQTIEQANAPATQPGERVVKVTALADARILVEQLNPSKYLLTKTMKKGEVASVTVGGGPFKVFFSDRQSIDLQINGQKIVFEGSGPGAREFP